MSNINYLIAQGPQTPVRWTENYQAGRRNALMDQSLQQKMRMENKLFEQGQEDRQLQLSAQQRQMLQQEVMGAAAGVIMAPPEKRAEAYKAGKQYLDQRFPGALQLPEEYDEGQFLGSVAPLFPKEVMQKIVQDRFQQKDAGFEKVDAGDRVEMYDKAGNLVRTVKKGATPGGGEKKQRRLVEKPLADGRTQKVWVDDDGNELGTFGEPAAKGGTGVPTQDERQTAVLLSRLQKAEGDITDALGENLPAEQRTKAQKSAEKPSLWAATVGLISDTGRNVANSKERQRVEAAQMDALDAALTLATGAAYTKLQLEAHRMSYFPQIGDDDTTVADKKARYDNLVEAAKIRAGRAMPGQPARGTASDDPNALTDAERAELDELRQGQR